MILCFCEDLGPVLWRGAVDDGYLRDALSAWEMAVCIVSSILHFRSSGLAVVLIGDSSAPWMWRLRVRQARLRKALDRLYNAAETVAAVGREVLGNADLTEEVGVSL